MGQWLSWLWRSNADELDAVNRKKEQWAREQNTLKEGMIEEDVESWQVLDDGNHGNDTDNLAALKFVGGLDISFIKGDDVNACAAFVVLSFPDLEVVYEDCCMMRLEEPYIAGFLAFREAPIYAELYQKLLSTSAIRPQVLMIDGNGKLHHRGFGIASHLGVTLDVPTIGVAKTLYYVDGLENNESHKQRMRSLEGDGDRVSLVGDSGTIYGAALRSTAASKNPVYVSVGHRISLRTALGVVHRCCRHRVPEPIRLADIKSREYIRINHGSPATS